MTGLIALLAALAAASLAGAALRRRAGRFSRTSPRLHAETLTSADLGAQLGERATLVQFSTEFCAYCGPARKLLGDVAAAADGVAVVEIDAAERLDLTRRLNVLATPTIFVLGPDGTVVSRSSGQPKKAAVLEAIGSIT